MKIVGIFSMAIEFMLAIIFWFCVGVFTLLGLLAFMFGRIGEWIFDVITIRPEEICEQSKDDIYVKMDEERKNS